MHLSKVPVRTVIAVAALVTIPLAVAATLVAGHATSAGSASSVVAPPPDVPAVSEAVTVSGSVAASALTSAATLQQCRSAAYLRPVGGGWGIPVPSALMGTSTNCNLRYGDDPHRGSQTSGDPDTAIRTLQRNLNYCYGSHLAVDGIYGSNTRAVVKQVQMRHHITADGIYGPQTRSAMNWRMFYSGPNLWSKGCYSPL
jgi:peptidoglycan hydrolase-like protein with peptidoglycan-binding domain